MFAQINFVEIFGAFIVMVAIIDIFGSIPIFVSMKEQDKTIKAGQACLTALGLFLAFFFAGDALLKLFGIDAASFAVAGSFVLFILAVEMILGRSSTSGNFETQSDEVVMVSGSYDHDADALRLDNYLKL